MNKKCGNCGYFTDKCKDISNKNFNKFRDKEDSCSGFKRPKRSVKKDGV